jgi:hypothetical protein
VVAYVCFFLFFLIFSLFSSTFFVDDSLWVVAPWKTQLDVSGLFYFSCKLWCSFYFFFVVLGYTSKVGFFFLICSFHSFIIDIGLSVILVDCWSVIVWSR